MKTVSKERCASNGASGTTTAPVHFDNAALAAIGTNHFDSPCIAAVTNSSVISSIATKFNKAASFAVSKDSAARAAVNSAMQIDSAAVKTICAAF